MRLFLLLLISILASAAEYPKVFSSAGDEIYENMAQYEKIKNLDIYQDRPELLESFCEDAEKSIKMGFALDKAEEDPEVGIDKQAIKAYAKELRRLSNQNENIKSQVRRDMQVLLEAKDVKHLRVFETAGFQMSPEMLKVFSEDDIAQKKSAKDKKFQDKINLLNQKNKKQEAQVEKLAQSKSVQSVKIETEVKEKTPEPKVIEVKETVILKEEPIVEEKVAPPKELSEIEKYQESLALLKEELYALRESGEQDKTACLNDITAINYWMIKVLENEKDACAFVDAIKQMKSYDKSAAESCGRSSMRYVEWHGRIKPYVGKRLFQAEALCSR